MKKLLILLSSLVLVFVLTGCGNVGTSNNGELSSLDSYVVTYDNYNENEQMQDSHIDYILVTNESNTIEPLELRIGENFLGLTLEQLDVQEWNFDSSGTTHRTVIANFSGDIVISGELQFWDAIPATPFVVHDEYLHLIPKLVDDERSPWFDIINDMELFEMLGISSLHELSKVGYSVELTIKINNFTIMYNDGGAMNQAYIVQVVDFNGISQADTASVDYNNPPSESDIHTQSEIRTDILSLLSLSYDRLIEFFGEPIEEIFEMHHRVYFENGVIVDVGSSVIIDFAQVSNLQDFHFNGIDGTSVYDDVVTLFGEPYNIRAEELFGAKKSYLYQILEGSEHSSPHFARFFFDISNNIVAIQLFILT